MAPVYAGVFISLCTGKCRNFVLVTEMDLW